MKAIVDLVRTYPARTLATLQAGFAVALAFGADITPEQIAAVLGFFSVLLGVAVHGAVKPMIRVEADAEAAKKKGKK